LSDPTQELLRQFELITGRQAEGIWTAPGRVNLIGEHTDYNEGLVLPMAIDRWVSVAAASREDQCIRGFSRQEEEGFEFKLATLAPGSVDGWAAYPAGAAWALKTTGIELRGTDLVIDSTIPAGAGLASSAALTTVVALCLSELAGNSLAGADLAAASHRAEAEFVGVPCGVMDQMISALGRRGTGLFLDTRTSTFEYVSLGLSGAGLTLAVVDTRVPHRLSQSAYARRRRECEEAAGALGVQSLRDVSVQDLPTTLERLSKPASNRVRHVVTENARVLEVVEAVSRADFKSVGAAFLRSHESLRKDYEVSCRELDTAVAAAMEAGALGARMTGAGFGGSAIVLVGRERIESLLNHTRSAFERQGFMEPAIFEVLPSRGAERV
jgi:galactokinase